MAGGHCLISHRTASNAVDHVMYSLTQMQLIDGLASQVQDQQHFCANGVTCPTRIINNRAGAAPTSSWPAKMRLQP